MGIININYLIEDDPARDRLLKARVAKKALLVDAHRRGEHPYGSMHRDCPLCPLRQLGK